MENEEQQNIPKEQQQQTITVTQNIVEDNEYGILYQTPTSCKLIYLRGGDKYQTTMGAYRHTSIIGQPWGSSIQAFNKPQAFLNVLKPKSTLITENLARKTQILYAMDNSAIIFKLNLQPGSVVVEAGTGSGSLSCAIAETIGTKGHLYTFQFNKERAEITKKFFEDLRKTNITSNWRDVVQDGFQLENKIIRADALFLDVPNPWAAIHHTKKVLKKHGRICCFSPCIEQVQRTTEELRKQNFIKIKTIECLSRQIYEQDQSLEGPQGFKRNATCSLAVHNNRGHTGYLTFALVL